MKTAFLNPNNTKDKANIIELAAQEYIKWYLNTELHTSQHYKYKNKDIKESKAIEIAEKYKIKPEFLLL